LEKSLFIPVIVSAVFFWYGSFINVVYTLCLQIMPHMIGLQDSINFLHQTTLLIGLTILTYGVFSYWRITRHVKLPKHERSRKQKDQQEELPKHKRSRKQKDQQEVLVIPSMEQVSQEA